MKVKSKNSQAWKYFSIILLCILFFSNSVFAGEIEICNKSRTELRLARFVLESSSLFGFDCNALSKTGCRARLWNWHRIGARYCETFNPGNFNWIYFAIQLKDKDGNWYSTSYNEDKDFLTIGWSANEYGKSGLSRGRMCVKENDYSIIYDRYVKGMAKAVYDEACQTGYSKIPVNIIIQTMEDLSYSVDIPYEAPPAKTLAKPVVIQKQPKKKLPVKSKLKKRKSQ